MPTPLDAYFHEDDYCQQEILPLAALPFCQQQSGEIEVFSAKHQADVGWTDVFVRKDSPAELKSLAIPVADLRRILGQHLVEFTTIYTGYSSHREYCKNTLGFGLESAGCFLFVDWDSDGIVLHIWTDLFDNTPEHLTPAVDAMQALGVKYPLLYVDWAWDFSLPIDGSEALAQKLREKLDEIARRRP